jgi:hypothetical protein
MKVVKLVLVILSVFVPAILFAQYNVKSFGAKGDGLTLDTRAIQNAIDKASQNKGGVVSVPPGIYKIGSLILKDNINLHLQAGAMLLGSPDYRDYTTIQQKLDSRTKDLYAKYFMIYAEGAKHISITGLGVIHGNGLENFKNVKPQNLRPYIMRLVNCENVVVRDVQFLESANWAFHLLACRDVNIEGIVIESRARGNRDGLDIDACQRVTVSNSRFLTTDDAIVLKTTNDILCQDIAITNCIMRTNGSAIKIGTESNGGFKNITVSNCVFKDVPNHAGIELMTVDGGMMQNILLDNITMDNVNTPIFIRVGNRARPFKAGQYVNKLDDVKDIVINNVSVINAKLPSSIMGMHNKPIKNVTISNYNIRYVRSQQPTAFNNVVFAEFLYPMAITFRNLPAYGLYCRNVEGLHLQNIRMYSAEGEARPALGFDRVTDLALFDVKAEIKTSESPMIYLRNSDDVTASFCRSLGISNSLFVTEDNVGPNFRFANNIMHNGQAEIARIASTGSDPIFEDFNTETKFSVSQGNEVKGLKSHSLDKPLTVNFDIANQGDVQLRLLVLNESMEPQKVIVKYLDITQEFIINWTTWGWAPITLLKNFDYKQQVGFEISSQKQTAGLQIAKAYLLYQDVAITD